MHTLLLLIGIDTLILFPAVPVALWGVLLSNKYRTKCQKDPKKRSFGKRIPTVILINQKELPNRQFARLRSRGRFARE